MKSYMTVWSDKSYQKRVTRILDQMKSPLNWVWELMDPSKQVLTPLVFVIASIWTIVTVGIAFGSMLTLFTSLLLLYFILTKVLKVNLDPRVVRVDSN